MEHEDKYPDQNLEQNNQSEEQDLQETTPSASTEAPSLLSDDSTLTHIRTQFGLSSRYLPENTSIQGLLLSLNNPDWRVRVVVARRLGSAGDSKDENVKTALIATLRDSAPAVRAAAARALGDLGENVPEESLLFLLRNDTDDDVRTAAAQALSASGDSISPYTVEGLKSTFDRVGESDITRSSIIYTLGGLGKRTPIDLLRSSLQDRDWLVREAAALMMGEQGERADEEALQELADKEDEYSEVTQAAHQALGNLAIEQSERLARSEFQVSTNEESL